MKKSMKFGGLVTKTSIAALLFGAFFVTPASAKTYNVDMVLDNTQTVLTVVSRGNCDNDNHPGCVLTKKKKNANIKFHLKREFADCNKADGAKWELSGVYLGGKNSPTKPESWGNLDAEVMDDFDVADAATGELKYANGFNKRKISISNKNQHEYSIWYTVKASCIGSNGALLGTVEVDPRVRNVGK